MPTVLLTGGSTWWMDTRVLQVLHAFDPAKLPVYVGQMMDVDIDAPVQKQLPKTDNGEDAS